VRGCGRPLAHQAQTLVCDGGHAFDVSRAGYVNLLQPHDRRSKHAGDSRDAVAARARLLGRGVGQDILTAVTAQALACGVTPASVVLDLGTGTGELLGHVVQATGAHGIGIDLSVPAVERASRRFPGITWVVANADRQLPVSSCGVSLILSMHARRNPSECARVLAPRGLLFVVVPGVDDLAELRALIGGQTPQNMPAASVLRDHAGFSLVGQHTFRESHHLEREALLDLLRSTYRGARRSAADRVEALDRLDVTLSSDLLILAPPVPAA